MKMFVKIFLLFFSRRIEAYKVMEPFVIGGENAEISEYPHAAFMHANYPMVYGCGSSVLNQWVLLTAAHCVADLGEEFSVDIFTGHSNVDKSTIYRAVSNYEFHKDYDEATTSCDIAVMFLQCLLPLGGKLNVKRVIIPDVWPAEIKSADLAGWGTTDDSNPDHVITSKVLKKVGQKVYILEKCKAMTKNGYVQGTVCGGDPKEFENRPAQGDSGSALITKNFQQIGLVSYRMDITPGLVYYTNTTYYKSWLIERVKEDICLAANLFNKHKCKNVLENDGKISDKVNVLNTDEDNSTPTSDEDDVEVSSDEGKRRRKGDPREQQFV